MPVHNVEDFDYFLIDEENEFHSFKSLQKFYDFIDQTHYFIDTIVVINFNYSECLKNVLYISKFTKDFFIDYIYSDSIRKIEYRLDFPSSIIIPCEKYQNLKKITIYSSRLTSLKYFENFNSLESLTLNYSKIRKIDGFFPNIKCINLSYNNFELDETFASIFPNATKVVLRECFLTAIPECFSMLNHLQKLNLGGNKLSSLPCVLPYRIEYLNLENNVFKYVPWCVTKLYKLTYLDLSTNVIDSISGLENLKELINLHIASNIIRSISGIEKLSKLETLNLSCNKIKDVTAIGKLTNLETLDLCCNQIETIDDLSSLQKLSSLRLGHNFIKDVTITKDLVYLEDLNIIDNLIDKLPVYNELTKLENIEYADNLFEKIDKINEIIFTKLKNVYNNGDNVHTTKIQDSIKESIINLMNDNYSITKEELLQELESENLEFIDEIKSYINDSDKYSSDEYTYFSVFIKVWGRIRNSYHKKDLIQRLNEEIKESISNCFVGRISRLINVLHGFFEDIHITISDSEQISNIILSIRKKYIDQDYDEVQNNMREEIIHELKERNYSDEIIKEWIENSL